LVGTQGPKSEKGGGVGPPQFGLVLGSVAPATSFEFGAVALAQIQDGGCVKKQMAAVRNVIILKKVGNSYGIA
jgi:hypothetical protein